MPWERGQEMAKKAVTWAVIAFLVFFVAFHPDTAARVTRSLGTMVVNVGKGFGDFFTRVAG
ncbi:hypothetical protein GCM10009835_50410 [Planosporangium flavigriseum]